MARPIRPATTPPEDLRRPPVPNFPKEPEKRRDDSPAPAQVPPRRTARLSPPESRPVRPQGRKLPPPEVPPGRDELLARLARIRDRIHRAQRYPEEARFMQVEGTAVVSFRIRPDGALAEVRLRKSSGHPILDKASIEAVHRAAPLPYVRQSLAVPLRYHLKRKD